jgi:hypothetical protein
MFLDGDGVNSIEFHCHGSPCPKGVATDIVLGEAKLVEPHLLDRLFERCVDVVWCDLPWVPWCFIIGADGEVLVISMGHDVGNSAGQGFDGASDFTSAVVTDALPTLPIFLVGNT